MKRKIWAAIIFGVIVVLGAVGCLLIFNRPQTNVVLIIQDGRELYRLDLDRAEDQIIEIEYNGKINTIEIRDHKIRMAAAECPDNTCVNMGWLDLAPIICVPNRLVIQFEDSDYLSGE